MNRTLTRTGKMFDEPDGVMPVNEHVRHRCAWCKRLLLVGEVQSGSRIERQCLNPECHYVFILDVNLRKGTAMTKHKCSVCNRLLFLAHLGEGTVVKAKCRTCKRHTTHTYLLGTSSQASSGASATTQSKPAIADRPATEHAALRDNRGVTP